MNKTAKRVISWIVVGPIVWPIFCIVLIFVTFMDMCRQVLEDLGIDTDTPDWHA